MTPKERRLAEVEVAELLEQPLADSSCGVSETDGLIATQCGTVSQEFPNFASAEDSQRQGAPRYWSQFSGKSREQLLDDLGRCYVEAALADLLCETERKRDDLLTDAKYEGDTSATIMPGASGETEAA